MGDLRVLSYGLLIVLIFAAGGAYIMSMGASNYNVPNASKLNQIATVSGDNTGVLNQTRDINTEIQGTTQAGISLDITGGIATALFKGAYNAFKMVFSYLDFYTNIFGLLMQDSPIPIPAILPAIVIAAVGLMLLFIALMFIFKIYVV